MGILDFLGTPTPDVEQELRGLAAENNIDLDNLDAVKFMQVPVEGTAELMAESRNTAVQYYQQTTSAYLEGLARAQIDAGMDVLEIGSERTHHMLRIIKDLCHRCYAVNIFFHVPQDDESAKFVTRILADMSTLPFENESVDLVIASATLHHAVNISRVLKEISRVLRPGCRAIIVNEPVEGLGKRLSAPREHGRHDDIHEAPVTWKTWDLALSQSGLRVDQFLPMWFINQVAKAESLSEDTRSYKLAKLLNPICKAQTVGELVRIAGRGPGQKLLGLPLNAVLWKEGRTNGCSTNN